MGAPFESLKMKSGAVFRAPAVAGVGAVCAVVCSRFSQSVNHNYNQTTVHMNINGA